MTLIRTPEQAKVNRDTYRRLNSNLQNIINDKDINKLSDVDSERFDYYVTYCLQLQDDYIEYLEHSIAIIHQKVKEL